MKLGGKFASCPDVITIVLVPVSMFGYVTPASAQESYPIIVSVSVQAKVYVPTSEFEVGAILRISSVKVYQL